MQAILLQALSAPSGFRHLLSNTSWIVLDRALRFSIGFLLTIWIARYFGPSGFGLLSFAIAWVALFSAFGNLGLEGIVIRDLVARPGREGYILGTAAFLRICGGLMVVIMGVLGYGISFGWGDEQSLAIVLVLTFSQVFLSAEVIDYWLSSRVEYKYVFRARIGAFAVSALIKTVLLLQGTSIFWIATVTLLEALLTSCLLLNEWWRHPHRVKGWQVSGESARELLRSAWPNLLSGIAIMIYMRIDQVMIGSLLSKESVGIYTAAVRLSEVWYVVPLAVAQSALPGIVASRKAKDGSYEEKLIRLVAVLFWPAVLLAAFMTIGAPFLIEFFFGVEYHAAGTVLQIHLWAGVFVAMGVAIGPWFLAEDLLRINLARTVTGAGVNIVLNLLLIPHFGIKGAAWATVISYFVSSYASIPLFRLALPAWRILNKGISNPWILLSKHK